MSKFGFYFWHAILARIVVTRSRNNFQASEELQGLIKQALNKFSREVLILHVPEEFPNCEIYICQ
jgi:hypothetical protein